MDEKMLKSLGFESEKEFHKLVSSVDLSTITKIEAFKRWQNADCSTDSLLKLIGE